MHRKAFALPEGGSIGKAQGGRGRPRASPGGQGGTAYNCCPSTLLTAHLCICIWKQLLSLSASSSSSSSEGDGKRIGFLRGVGYLNVNSCSPVKVSNAVTVARRHKPRVGTRISMNFPTASSPMLEFGPLDDVVMGGVSESTFQVADGAGLFSGVVKVGAIWRTAPPCDAKARAALLLRSDVRAL